MAREVGADRIELYTEPYAAAFERGEEDAVTPFAATARRAVELGLGVGIMADIAFNPERDRQLRAMPVGHLFGGNVTRVALKQGAYLRSYIYTLVELLSPSLNRRLVEQALKGEHETYEL